MKQLVFYNQSAGKSAQLDSLRDSLSAHDTTWVELTRDVEIAHEIHEFLTTGGQTVIAAGGDGTVHAVVNGMMQIEHSKRPKMAIVPLGTANDFAGTLHIPDEIKDAVAVIHHGATTAIDVVRIRGEGLDRYYSNVAAGGNCVRVSEELTDEIKARWGALCYLRGAIGVLADMQSYRITADLDDQRIENLDTWAVLIANGKTNAGRIEVAPHASPSDGMFDVIIIRDGTVLDMVDIVAKNLTGQFLESEQVLFRKAKRIRLQSNPPMRFTLDGELIDEQPIEFEVIPGAIDTFVGPEFQG
ncbi:diacylglycerol/lipid kinase family protein [Allorhodopirellula heiligendammensis]|uniref:Diacylglycerol kinase n=1 Tax=Allorhodopirellula heiligendammensis TaxID=2714739 RepID=A0A5C6C414_9BACT|nr:diacylglycerol kinase family protein [Allorhodopirellula heiligendammensis]TWU18044.1 Diacylglycerol kinase [Allorhodopirellula heiligendammensis]